MCWAGLSAEAKMACRRFAVIAALFALCSVGYSLDNGKLSTSPYLQPNSCSISFSAPPSIRMPQKASVS